MVVYRGVWLCMECMVMYRVYGYVWRCMVMYRGVWLCMEVYSGV